MYHLWVYGQRERQLTMMPNFMNNAPGVEATQPAAWKSYNGALSYLQRHKVNGMVLKCRCTKGKGMGDHG